VQDLLQRETNVNELRIVTTFATLTDTAVPDPEITAFFLNLWNCSFLPNDMREFLFKERNNCLPLANRIGNYIENVNERCSFCRILNPETNQREDYNHLFLDCPVTRSTLNGFLRLSRSHIQGNHPELKKAYWNGVLNGQFDKNVALIFALFRFCTWKFKIRKRVPRALELLTLLQNLLSTIIGMRPKIRTAIINGNTFANLIQALG